MRKFAFAVLGLVLFFSLTAYAGTDMTGHMKEHMVSGMGKTDSGNETGKENSKALTQEAEAASITAKVTYKNPGEAEPLFNVVLDTHYVDLDRYEFDKTVVLRDSAGVEYRPQIISESGSGHHKEAILRFEGAGVTESKVDHACH